MMQQLAIWNWGLVFAALSVLLAIMGLITCETVGSRWRSYGLGVQGVILAFTAGVVYLPESIDLRLAGVVVTGLLIIQQLLEPDEYEETECIDQGHTE